MATLPTLRILASCLAVLLVGCAQRTQWVSVGDIEASLPPHPISVGFDVDETLLCSTAIWYHQAANHDGPGGTNKYGYEIRKHPDFWADANRLDGFSLPKERARQLVAMHQRRGDRICIITSRPKTDGEQLSDTLRADFKLSNDVPIVFTSQRPKSEAMRPMHLAIFYGDADEDMRDARAVGARPIRFLRTIRCADDRIHLGTFGEEVLLDSDLCSAFLRAGAATRPATK